MAYTPIDRSSNYFRVKTYTGNGSARSITFDETANMSPDLLWIKSRSNAYSHLLFDSVRGVSKRLISNSTNAESTETQITSFDSNGWTMDSDSANNGNGLTYVAWAFDANGSGVSNTAGSISSTVSVNTTSGFSIVSWVGNQTAGASCGHGLGVAPSMIIKRRRNGDGADYWYVYHKSLGSSNSIYLNTTDASGASGAWNSQTPTSSVFYHGSSIRENGGNMIAYCFAEVKGFSKAGSYVANGSSDGNFIYTGFTPAFILTKCSSTDNGSTYWCIFDNKREGYNGANDRIFPNVSNAESNDSPSEIDILSNGFKIRGVSSSHNISGQTFIYMAFASSPFVSSKGLPTTAR